MASFNDPQITNDILSDVPAIHALLRSVAMFDPATGNTDIPENAKRLIGITGGQQFQTYSGSAWVSIGKLMHDVDTVDGFHASKLSTSENYIPAYKAGGVIAGGCEGNAGTATKLKTARKIDIGGIASATEKTFDGSGNITIPINSINVSNEGDNALVGIVSKAHGGTGRNDGAAADVILANGGKASEYGQIGYSKDITGISLDTLVEPGDYISYGMSIENSWPYSNSTFIGRVRVSRFGRYISQLLFCGGETLWQRVSTNTGASWSKLEPSGGNRGSSITIYISKSGNDNNTGMDNAHPVLTINRALKIADGWKPTQLNTTVKLCLGEGDWGDVTFSSLPYTINIYPYDGVAATSYSESLPKFGTLSFLGTVYASTRGVVADTLDANGGAFVDIANSVTRFGQLRSRYSATIDIYNSTLEVMNTGGSLDQFRTYHGGRIVVGADSTCKVVDNISVDTAFLYMTSCSEILNFAAITFSVANGVQVTGKKYAIASGSSVHYTSKSFLDSLPGMTAGTLSTGVVVGGVPYGGGDASQFLAADLTWKTIKGSDAVNSDSSDTLASSKAVKAAYDAAVAAQKTADTASSNATAALNDCVKKAGDTMTGGIFMPDVDVCATQKFTYVDAKAASRTTEKWFNGVNLSDKNNVRLGVLQSGILTNGQNIYGLSMRNKADTGYIEAQLHTFPNGTNYFYANCDIRTSGKYTFTNGTAIWVA